MAHKRPLPGSRALNFPELFDAGQQGFDKKSRQGNALVDGKMFGLAQDVLRKGKSDVLFLHVFTCNTQYGAASTVRQRK